MGTAVQSELDKLKDENARLRDALNALVAIPFAGGFGGEIVIAIPRDVQALIAKAIMGNE